MEIDKIDELKSFLNVLPPVGFCCVYGSSLHPNNSDKSSMVDFIIGVSDPKQWHSENMELNEDHYASWMVPLGGAKLITQVADKIGVGVHFNPFVTWNDKMLKYGVVRMHDLVQDVLHWERFYLSGRLQKPVHILVDNLDIGDVNSVNLRAAVSAALLLLPSKFTEEDLYSKICSLSYMGDLRMLFAEDKNKVKRIVEGQFGLFQSMYRPFLKEYEAKELLTFSLSNSHQANISQVYSNFHILNSKPVKFCTFYCISLFLRTDSVIQSIIMHLLASNHPQNRCDTNSMATVYPANRCQRFFLFFLFENQKLIIRNMKSGN
ncbi:hypothetical protein OIU84_023881 [Salix udensis]|uniref:Phosphatidate cytidylyltransferase, mitochondrial n=1 Tax=Salix udensis TaxID=889485 RepID=A0AAD6PFI0_9ROSI|nr:hypothetical protein OIU84_023881 [Salix udensis]